MEESKKAKRGFAAMDPEKRRKIASKGGKAVPAEKRSFATNREMAAEAGRKGGKNVSAEKRSFSSNPKLAKKAGSLGGLASRAAAKTNKP